MRVVRWWAKSWTRRGCTGSILFLKFYPPGWTCVRTFRCHWNASCQVVAGKGVKLSLCSSLWSLSLFHCRWPRVGAHNDVSWREFSSLILFTFRRKRGALLLLVIFFSSDLFPSELWNAEKTKRKPQGHNTPVTEASWSSVNGSESCRLDKSAFWWRAARSPDKTCAHCPLSLYTNTLAPGPLAAGPPCCDRCNTWDHRPTHSQRSSPIATRSWPQTRRDSAVAVSVAAAPFWYAFFELWRHNRQPKAEHARRMTIRQRTTDYCRFELPIPKNSGMVTKDACRLPTHSHWIMIQSRVLELQHWPCFISRESLTLSLPRVSISNFPCSLTRNITSHSMENLAFHSLFRWKMIIPQILTTSLIHLSFKIGRMYFLGSERVKTKLS